MTHPPAMPKDSKPALTPKLRFPEFRGRDTWERLTLRQVTTALLDGDWIESKDQSDSGYRLIQTGNIGVGEFIAKSGKARYVSEETFARLRCTEIFPGDCLVSRLPDPAGRSCFIPDIGEKMITAVDCTIVRFDQTKIVPYLFIAHSQTGGYFREVAALSSGSTRQRISRENLSGLTLPLPPTLAEQQKIAECLSTLDELIGAESQKLDALKAHKKGLMQQLFPREGETLPRLRFPEFQSAPEWQMVPLGTIADIKLGKMLDSQKHTTGKLLPYLNNIAVRWNAVDTTNLPKMYFDDHELERFGLKAGDVVVCEGGEPGRSAVWDGHLPDLKFQKAIHRVRFNVPFEPHLLVQYLEAIAGTPQFEKLFTGGGIKHLTRETFAKLEVPLVSEAEQHRIATCLSSLDDLIAAQSDRLSALQTHKQGLLQQLFPSTAEVSA